MTPAVKPEWRTDSVTALCQSMRETQDYSALPILADALQDAGCDDTTLLTAFRLSMFAKWQAEQLVALVYSEKTEAAVKWMEQFVRDINYSDNDGYDEDTGREINPRPSDSSPHDYEYVVRQGRVGAGLEKQEWGGHRTMCFGSDDGADYFRGSDGNLRTFYSKWSLATGLPMPDDLDEIHFRCAC